jgi:hypothetical protein
MDILTWFHNKYYDGLVVTKSVNFQTLDSHQINV